MCQGFESLIAHTLRNGGTPPISGTGVKLIPAYAPPEDGKPRNAVDEKWMKLTNSARHYLSRRANTRADTADESESRHRA